MMAIRDVDGRPPDGPLGSLGEKEGRKEKEKRSCYACYDLTFDACNLGSNADSASPTLGGEGPRGW
jgi:hypothetical protein